MSAFTRRHYDMIAATLRRDKPVMLAAAEGSDRDRQLIDAKRGQWRSTRERMVDLFLWDNPRFDADRFRAACG